MWDASLIPPHSARLPLTSPVRDAGAGRMFSEGDRDLLARVSGARSTARAGIAALAFALMLALGGCLHYHGPPRRFRSGQCKPGKPLAGVYLPCRLHVVKTA